MTRMYTTLPVDRSTARMAVLTTFRSKRIRVLTAANSTLLQRGIQSILGEEEDIELVGHATSGNEALKLIRELRPDVAVLNFNFPDRDALQVLELVRRTNSKTRTVILAARMDEGQFLRAVELGARGVLLKEMPAPMLARCIRKVHAGDEFFEKDVLHRSFGKLLRSAGAEKEVAELLTSRELATVRLAVSGLSNKQIAKKLSISEGTVKMHLHRSYEKLGLHGRMHLLLYAQREGLV